MTTVAAGLLLALLALGALPAHAQTNAGDPGLQRLTLTPAPGTTFKIVAEYDNAGVTCKAKERPPLRARYAGELEVVRTADGELALVNELTFDDYLGGLAEVPRSWPMEALKAQVIAARSYALYHYERNPGTSPIGYDLCSTDACQVYRGLSVAEGAFGDAWKKAVADTDGQVLTYRDKTIQAFYFSTSWGRTVSNAEGFGGSPLPYLKPASGEDDDAPLAHWHVELPLTDLTAILRASGDWSGATITSARVSGSNLVLGSGSGSSSISLTRFRRSANNQAACLFPSRYPPKGAEGRKIPQTVPSPHFALKVSGGKVILDGRGWGHGVGMSQYGARSLASRGRSASDILSHFYAGLRPVRVREPGTLRVLVADNSVRVRVESDGPFTARGPSGAVSLGNQFEVKGGRSMTMTRSGSITPVLSVAIEPETQKTLVGGRAAVRYELPSSAKVQAILLKDGAEVRRGDVVSQTSGSNVLALDLTGSSGEAVAPGVYQVTVEATDGVDTVRARPVEVTVQALPPVANRSPGGETSRAMQLALAVGLFALATAVLTLLFVRARRRA